MLPPQQIGRVVIVLKEESFPIPFGMAAFAFFGEVALMFVVLFVAGMAVGRRLVLIQAPFMAGIAFRRDMPSP